MKAIVKDISFNEIHVKDCRKIGMFESALCKVAVSLSLDCIMGIDIVSD